MSGQYQLQHLVLERGNHEQQTSIIRRRIVVHRPSLGTMIVTDGELTPTRETTPFEDIAFLCRRMAMRRIPPPCGNTHEKRHPARSRIIGKHLRNHTVIDVEPSPVRRFNKDEPIGKLSRGHRTN